MLRFSFPFLERDRMLQHVPVIPKKQQNSPIFEVKRIDFQRVTGKNYFYFAPKHSIKMNKKNTHNSNRMNNNILLVIEYYIFVVM